MKLPLITKRTRSFYPSNSKCPVCNKNRTNHSFAALNAGGLLNNGDKSFSPSEKMIGFFSLIWHTAEKYESIDIVENAKGGQFEFYFCSTACMRQFLNTCIDELENKLSI